MDTAVALVEAYLHSGYFAVAGYAVLEALRGEQVRTVTDLGILACRFAGPDTELVRDDGHRPLEPAAMSVDPALECPSDRPKCSLVTSRKVRTAQSAPPKIGCARGSPPDPLRLSRQPRTSADQPAGHHPGSCCHSLRQCHPGDTHNAPRKTPISVHGFDCVAMR